MSYNVNKLYIIILLVKIFVNIYKININFKTILLIT